jgi:hypothetical protein
VKYVIIKNNCVTLLRTHRPIFIENKIMKIAGILLLVIGLGLTLFTGFTYFTREKVVDIGGIEISKNEPHHVNIPLVFSIAMMGVGGAFLWVSYNKNNS